MNENLKKFLERLANDQELVSKMSTMKDSEEAYKLAASLQDGFTKEEFISAMDKLDAAAKGSEELSDEDLKNVAGGGTVEVTVGATAGVAISAAAWAAAGSI